MRCSGAPVLRRQPKTLLRAVRERLRPRPQHASLRSLYTCRQTLYEHPGWAYMSLDLQDLDAARVDKHQKVLAISALDGSSDNLAETARIWLYKLCIVIPGPRRLAGLAHEALNGTATPRDTWLVIVVAIASL